jgi:hypothetical protein
MWNVDPRLLCRKHLLGEHVETHMFCGSKTSLEGYIKKGLVELHNIKKRHDVLVVEMNRRGWNHKSPIEDNPFRERRGVVDSENNLKELATRCKACRERQHAYDV